MSTKPAPKADKAAALAAHPAPKAAEAAPEKAETGAPAGKTITIKVGRMHPKLGVWTGETTTVNAELAMEMIEGGFAEKVK